MPTACVTGATGYVAAHVINELIKKGYKTRGTVRNLSDPKKIAPLRAAFPSDKLELFEADLIKEGSFDAAFAGCDYVFHVATPVPWFLTEIKDPYNDIVAPAVNGTLNVLRSVEKAGTVKRIVLTSSVAALIPKGKIKVGYAYSEIDWNYESTMEAETYRYAKRVQEEEAWKFVKGKSYDMVVVLPSMVYGPLIYPRDDATSILIVKKIMDGVYTESGTPPINHPAVDVRDVALAHILAAENKNAEGRYLLSATDNALSFFEIAEILIKSGKFGAYALPTKEAAPVTHRLLLNTQRSRDHLGYKYAIPADQSLIEMAECLDKLGLVQKKL